jgi:phosphoribosylaminoimidazole-succinocarboxamide synthase
MSELIETDFHFPDQVGDVYSGKVGDVYTISHEIGELAVVVRTDRISAYDAKFPEPIPHKGQVLNQMSAELLEATEGTAPSWLIATPDPNVSIGLKADPIKVEMIVRAYLLGSAWKAYDEEDMRQLCDHTLLDGMLEFDPFAIPLVTPTTKSLKDENITRQEIIDRGLATEQEYDEMEAIALDLFETGQGMAHERDLVLADTKYEMGRLANGEIIVIDEVHTPDSSRYFIADEFDDYVDRRTSDRPQQLSKEFLREWLKAQGFTNQPGETRPALPNGLIQEISAKYINLYERMTGKSFIPADSEDAQVRIEENVVAYLESLS